jgi:hypothetical protein
MLRIVPSFSFRHNGKTKGRAQENNGIRFALRPQLLYWFYGIVPGWRIPVRGRKHSNDGNQCRRIRRGSLALTNSTTG